MAHVFTKKKFTYQVEVEKKSIGNIFLATNISPILALPLLCFGFYLFVRKLCVKLLDVSLCSLGNH